MVSTYMLFLSLNMGTMLMLTTAMPCIGDGIMNDTCGDTEDASSFLQIASRVTSKSNGTDEQGPTIIQPWPCLQLPKPIQVLKDGEGFAFKELEIQTGKYKDVFKVPFKRTNPPYKDLNSCGINPVDSIPYCTMWDSLDNHYIVRVGSKKIEIVAALPKPKGKTFNTGTFSPDGTYYIADQKANFLVLKGLAKVKGVVPWTPERNPQLSKKYARLPLQKPNGFHSAADVVVVKNDLEGLGDKEYVVVLNKGSLMIARFDNGRFKQTWKFSYKKGNKPGNNKDIWGAGWFFGGKVFFAHNKGEGVFEIPFDQINLRRKSLAPVTLSKVGKSQASGFNDGANCMNAGNPWVTQVFPVDCRKNPTPLQAMRHVGNGYAFKKLDMSTGQYTGVSFLPFTRTSPPFKYLNAIGVNPIDSISYGCLLFDDFPASFWIVRFDGKKIEFVTKVLDKYDPVAGTFNSKGDYFVMQNNNYTHDIEMFAFSGLDKMKGYANPNAKALPVVRDIKFLKLWNLFHFSDLVTVKHNFQNTGEKEYIMAINRERQVVYVDWNMEDVSASKVIKSNTNYPFPKKMYYNYGAAWNYNNRIFFAANDGLGVVEASAVTALGNLTLTKVGKSAQIVNTDGFNCWKIDSPFPSGRGGVARPAFK